MPNYLMPIIVIKIIKTTPWKYHFKNTLLIYLLFYQFSSNYKFYIIIYDPLSLYSTIHR